MPPEIGARDTDKRVHDAYKAVDGREGIPPELDDHHQGADVGGGSYQDHVVRQKHPGVQDLHDAKASGRTVSWFRPGAASPGFSYVVSDFAPKDLSPMGLDNEISSLKIAIAQGKDWIHDQKTGYQSVPATIDACYQRLISLMTEKRSRMLDEKKANVGVWDYQRNRQFSVDYDLEVKLGDKVTEDYRQFLDQSRTPGVEEAAAAAPVSSVIDVFVDRAGRVRELEEEIHRTTSHDKREKLRGDLKTAQKDLETSATPLKSDRTERGRYRRRIDARLTLLNAKITAKEREERTASHPSAELKSLRVEAKRWERALAYLDSMGG